jgi:hypothetical protein
MPARGAGRIVADMTASTSTQIYSRPLIGRGMASAAAVGAAGLLTLVAISVASLAVAFPIVLSLVERGRITLSAADLATSRQMAGLAWAFVAMGGLHLVAAAAAIGRGRWIQRAGLAVTGAGAGLSAAATLALLRDPVPGAAGVPLLLGAAGLYLFSMAAIAARRSHGA